MSCAPQRSCQVIPLFLACEIGAWIIMLDMEDQNTQGSCDEGDRHLNEKILPDAVVRHAAAATPAIARFG